MFLPWREATADHSMACTTQTVPHTRNGKFRAMKLKISSSLRVSKCAMSRSSTWGSHSSVVRAEAPGICVCPREVQSDKESIQRSELSSLMRTRPEGGPQQMAQCVYRSPCECGRSYTGETGRPLAVRAREPRHNLRQGLLEKSKLAQHAYEERHRVGCSK
jgi:hypothetical protein